MIVDIIKNMKAPVIYLLTLVLFYPKFVFAKGKQKGHRPCSQCHEMKGKEAQRVRIKPDTKTINPHTAKPYGPVDGICVSCHSDLLHANAGHVVGIHPEKANVPYELMEFKGQEGELTCLSCHDPHHEKTKYKFLRWGITGKKDVKRLCQRCHSREAPHDRFSRQESPENISNS